MLNTKNKSYLLPLFVCIALVLCGIRSSAAESVRPFLPEPGELVSSSEQYVATYLKGMIIDHENPFRFNFIVDPGNDDYDPHTAKTNSLKQIKYFLTALTIPEQEQWVNLSPYEADRMIPESLGRTSMGRDLLAQDYLLKQVAASMMYPEDQLGSHFWNRVYERAYDQFGSTEIPLDTINKVWVVPDVAVVHEEDKTVLILESRLKVMMEADYLAASQFLDDKEVRGPPADQDSKNMTADIIRQVIIPAIEQEVNHGKHFAPLRQMYHSMILATWYKNKLSVSPLHQAYANQNKMAGISREYTAENAAIYDRYVLAFRRGVYNYIKEDIDEYTGDPIPRKYFSGGMDMQDRRISVRRPVNSQQLVSVHDQGYLSVGVDLFPAFNPQDGIVGAAHQEGGLLFDQFKQRLGVIAERYGWGRVFSQLELNRSEDDKARIDKFFELLTAAGIDHLPLLGLADRIIPVNVNEWRLSTEDESLGGLIVRHNGVLKIIFPRQHLMAPDSEVLANLLHELVEVTLLENGMEVDKAHELASEVNNVLSQNDVDEVELALRNGVEVVNVILDRHLDARDRLPPVRENPLSNEQLTRINTALMAKQHRSIRKIQRQVKSARSLNAVMRDFADARIPEGEMRRISLSTNDLLRQIQDGVLDQLEIPVALFRLTGTDDWVVHKGSASQKRTKIQLGQDLLPGYAYDVYLQSRPGLEGFAKPDPNDIADFGSEDVDKIHAVISAGGGLTFVDVKGLVREMSKEEILGMGKKMDEQVQARIPTAMLGATPDDVRQQIYDRELDRLLDQGLVRITQVPWSEVDDRLFPRHTFVLWNQFADPSFNVRKRAIALLFHLRDQLGLSSVIPVFNAVIESLSEEEQLDLFDHRTYPFSGMVFMEKDDSRSLFEVSQYPIVRGVVSLDGWNSRTLWNYFMEQSRLRVMSKDLFQALPGNLAEKIRPMVDDPQIKDGLVIASKLTNAERESLGRDFLEAYTEQLKNIGLQRQGVQDPLIAAAEELRLRWQLDGVVGAANMTEQNPGGIDFDPRWMTLQLQGVPSQQPVLDLPVGTPRLLIEGLIPEIYGITPMPTLVPLLSDDKKTEPELLTWIQDK